MTQLAQCPGCQHWVQSRNLAVGRLRCPGCGAQVQAEDLNWQVLTDWICEDSTTNLEEATQNANLPPTVSSTDQSVEYATSSRPELVVESNSAPVVRALELPGMASREAVSEPKAVSIQPTMSAGLSSSLASRRSAGARRRPLAEFAKIVAGGAAGILIAQAILWWLPGSWRRDPLQLAPHVPPALQFLVPPELRPWSPPPEIQFVPPGTGGLLPALGDSSPGRLGDETKILPSSGSAEAVVGESASAESPSEVPAPSQDAGSTAQEPAVEPALETPSSVESDSDPNEPTESPDAKVSPSPSSGATHKRRAPVIPAQATLWRPLQNASRSIPRSQSSFSLAGSRQLSSAWRAADEELDRYESGWRPTTPRTVHDSQANRVFEQLCRLAVAVDAANVEEYPEIAQQLNDVDGLLARIADQHALLRYLAARSIPSGRFAIGSDGDAGVVLVAQVRHIRAANVEVDSIEAGEPTWDNPRGTFYVVEFQAVDGLSHEELTIPVLPKLDSRQPFEVGDWLLVLAICQSSQDAGKISAPLWRIALHQVLDEQFTFPAR